MHNFVFRKTKQAVKRSLAVALAVATTVTLLPNVKPAIQAASSLDPEQVTNYKKYAEPVSVDADSDGTKETVWSTFTYGSYPQSQVEDSNIIAQLDALSTDAWTSLENPYTNYLAKSNSAYAGQHNLAYTTLNGDKYLRMSVYDTASGTTKQENGMYQWKSETAVHYFKYEPITWRVLSVNKDGSDALVIADKVLDSQPFNYSTKIVNNRKPSAWKYSTLRSYLNGFDSKENAYKANYATGYSFMDLAFSDVEQAYIKTTTNNNTEGDYSVTYSSPSEDKLYCLSLKEVRTSSYGLTSDNARTADCTAFAKQSGIFGDQDYAFWWTRSGGDAYVRVSNIDYMGDIHSGGNSANKGSFGVRPAMHLDLSALADSAFSGYVDENGYTYANRITFNLDGKKTYTYTSSTNNYVFLPYQYEAAGYDYNYSITSSGKTVSIHQFPLKIKANKTINVTRTVQEDTITVYYKAASNWSKANIHFRVADGEWTDVPGVAMEACDEVEGYNYKYVIKCNDQTSATVCFTNGSGSWNSNNGKNFSLNGLGVYAIKGTTVTALSVVPTATPVVTEAPTATPVVTEAPTATPVVTVAPTNTPVVTVAPTSTPVAKTITVYYNTGWTNPHIHYQVSANKWTDLPGVAMEKTSEISGYTYKYTITLAEGQTGSAVCFNNGSNSWDSHNGANYYLSSAGTYGVSNGTISKLK